VLPAVGHQPEFQRVHAGHVAPVRQVEGVEREALVQLRHAGRLGRLVAQAGREEGAQGFGRCRGLQVAEHRGQPVGAGAQAVEQHVAQLGRGAVVGLAPEAAQEGLAFAVGEQGQVGVAARIEVVLQQPRGVAGPLVHGVAHDLAQQAHEGQVDGGLHGLAQAGLPRVVLAC
jgi:hypothetical protein